MNICAGPQYGGRPRVFSSASLMGGLGGSRGSCAPVCQPMPRQYGAGGYSSISLNNFGGPRRRISCSQGYGGPVYGGIGGQGFSGQSIGLAGHGVGIGGHCIGGPGIGGQGIGIGGQCIPGHGVGIGGPSIGIPTQCIPGQGIGIGGQGIGMGGQCIPGQGIGIGGQGIGMGGQCIPGQGIGGQYIPGQGIGIGGHGMGIAGQGMGGQIIGGQGIGVSYGGPECQGGFGGLSTRMGSMGGGVPCREGIRGVSIDERLLKPLSVGVDPEEQKARTHEKEEMKTLNNQFACFIDKVRSLEQQNKVLATKWELLNQCVQPARKNMESYYENFIATLKKQLECLLSERGKLEHEQKNMQELVEEYRSKYEDEVNRRTTAENEFVVLKKEVDCVFLTKEELESKVDVLAQELEILRPMFAEELAQLESQIVDTSVVLKMDNTRDLDMDLILQNVETWYQNIAHASKQEAEAFYHNKIAEIQNNRTKFNEELKNNQHEIAELNRVIQRLHTDHDNVKKQVASLQSAICDAEHRGDIALKDARNKHVELQNAYQKAKDKLASLLRDCQELLNTKLALDIEITTYNMMLEGEENRICAGNPVSVAMVSGGYPVGECAPGMGAGMSYGAAPYGGMGEGFTSGSAGCIHTMGSRGAAGAGYGVGHGSGGAGSVGAFSSKSGGGYASGINTKHMVGSGGGGRHSSGFSVDGSCVSGHHGGIHHAMGSAGGIAGSTGSGGYNTGVHTCRVHSAGAGGPGSEGGMSAAMHGGSRGDLRNVHASSVSSSSRKFTY